MNIARKLYTAHQNSVSRSLYRKFRFSSSNYDASHSTQPQVQQDKFDFEDLQVLERTERRKAKISPFMKDVFVSIFNRDMLAFPEIMTKDESEDVDRRIEAITKVFNDPQNTKADRREILKRTKMFSAPINLTNNGLAMNFTESLRYLEVIGDDFELGQEISDHWVALQALQHGLTSEQYNGVIDDLTTGEKMVTLCIKERVAERLTQADFRTIAEIDEQGIWKISGEKVCILTDSYILVLAAVEGSRLKGFLIHPRAQGLVFHKGFVSFINTPGTPLDNITESRLAQILSTSRLHAATLCRTRLRRATFAVSDYVKPRAFGGKPLSDLSLIRAAIGDSIIDMYASESAEYFTAALLDGYQEPDAEVEVAMCRNFMANHGLSLMMKLLSIPALDQQDECKQMLDDMRHLTARGETLDGINMFIAMNGIHHAGVTMAEEIKQIRNPLLHPAFIFKKAFANRHQENDDPKLTLHLSEHLHPSLKPPSDQLEYCVLRMRFACETLMSRHGQNVPTAYTELSRLAEAGSEVLAMTAVLARASRSYCIGIRNSEVEMKLAACFVDRTKDRVRRLIKDIDDGEYLNLDHFRIAFGKKMIETNSTLVEKPTTRVFW